MRHDLRIPAFLYPAGKRSGSSAGGLTGLYNHAERFQIFIFHISAFLKIKFRNSKMLNCNQKGPKWCARNAVGLKKQNDGLGRVRWHLGVQRDSTIFELHTSAF